MYIYDITNKENILPSVSKAQAAFMRAVAHNKEFAKHAGVPQSVGKEFEAADKAKASKQQKTSAVVKRYGYK